MKRFSAKWLILAMALLVFASSCGVPYKIMPNFYTYENQIQTIALYPLMYTSDGEKHRLFGRAFSELFPSKVQELKYKKPLKFLTPEETVNLLASAGITVESKKAGVIPAAPATEFTVYRPLGMSDLKAIADKADAVLVCNLKGYNEVSAESEAGQMALQACLSVFLPFYYGTSESNFVNMDVTLMSMADGQLLWTYGASSSASLKKVENTRAGFTDDIVKGIGKYCPLSATYEVKK